ncbi:hexamerin-1.1-like [Culex pipiens pallens]|uniref:hexamerin-1.1-like n=1 Tax=Culex pipiens pallens TaxID=42434 RepID=UPI00195358CF|nr:hexamerin-1.1-like [Culex pipiens pallens]
MRWSTAAVALCLVAVACAGFIPTGQRAVGDIKYADKDFLMKQKFFFEMLRNIQLPLMFEEYLPYTKTWIADESKYINYNEVVEFFDNFKLGFLTKGEIFTIYNLTYMKQTYLLFTFFYNSADWDTFYKNVVWARENVNEGMFIYALTMAVFQRPELKGFVLPPIYEIYPYYFFNTDMIHKAMFKKMYEPKFGFTSNGKYNVVYSNYTAVYPIEYMGEEKLSYFTEDIGLNSYYYYFMMDYPIFMGTDRLNLFKDRRGEQYLYMYQQLLARYYLERQANFLQPLGEFPWDQPIKTGYWPKLSYWNGVPFNGRKDDYTIPKSNYFKFDLLKSYEERIRQVIDLGTYTMPDGTVIDFRKPESIDYLGNMINSNPDSLNDDYFKNIEILTRIAFSGSDFYFTGSKVWPSSLMHFETSLRDPLFYQLYFKIMGFYWHFKDLLPRYTFDELNFKGLEIKNVAFDKLATYFEYYDSDISNIIPMGFSSDKFWDFSVLARQKRINHKPFSYTMDVMSEFAGKGVVRMFMGPKMYDMQQLQHLRKYFFQVDQYLYDFVAGKNTIVRNSRDYYWSVKDRTSYVELYKKIMTAYKGGEKFPLDMSEAHCGFPDRLLLPKGLPSGFEMTFYFVITPYYALKDQELTSYDFSYSCGVGSGSRYMDSLPLGFPLDRDIDFTYFFTKNMYYKNVMVYHFDEMKMNQTY